VPVSHFFGGLDCYGETGVEILENSVLVAEVSVGSLWIRGCCGKTADGIGVEGGGLSGETG